MFVDLDNPKELEKGDNQCSSIGTLKMSKLDFAYALNGSFFAASSLPSLQCIP